MPLSLHGLREWGSALMAALAASAVAVWLGWTWALAPIWLIWVAVAAFFRDPPRHVPSNLPPTAFVSPADGVITAIERVQHHEAVEGPALVIRIFLSVLDVHINRAPCDATVVRRVHRPGKYLDARTAESAKVNESNLIILKRYDGTPIGVRQVSGAIARRIVDPLADGQQITRGQRMGMIKFGSTTELILPRPTEVQVHVQVGQRVSGAVTVFAELA